MQVLTHPYLWVTLHLHTACMYATVAPYMDTTATVPVRIYPSTHKRLKIRAAELGWSLAQVIDYAESVMKVKYPSPARKKLMVKLKGEAHGTPQG